MRYGKHVSNRRRVLVAIVRAAGVVAVLTLAGATFAGYRYDRERAGVVLPGVRVAGVDLGGMTRSEAKHALRRLASKFLDPRITVRAGDQEWHITPRSMGARAEIRSAVHDALAVSDSLGWISRLYHRALNKPLHRTFELSISYDPTSARRLVSRIAQAVEVAPTNASRDYYDGALVVSPSSPGRELRNPNAAVAAINRAVRGAKEIVELSTRQVAPAVTEDDFGMLIVVRVSENRLYLYDGATLVRRYPVATGQPQYPTPQGHFEVVNKRTNPTWVNPAKDTWGKDSPDFIPPGPDNPLGTRALDLDAPGIRIHGTPDDASIGTYASHGCIRMHIPDSEDLFGRVDVGTPVIITD